MKTFNITVQTRKLLADLQTPVGIYLKVRDLYPESALLESSDFHAAEDSFSFIGIHPLARFIAQNDELTLHCPDGTIKRTKLSAQSHIVDEFRQFSDRFCLSGENESGINGFFGYTSYEAVRYFEEVNPINHVEENGDIPDLYYLFYRYILVINHLKNELIIVENIPEGETSRSEELSSVLRGRHIASYDFAPIGKETSYITDNDYREMVERGIAHCQRGDVFQIVLSRCFAQKFSGDEFKLYRMLRNINPSPYLFFFDFGSFRIFGSSPETHCRIQKGKAYIDPIAGTYKRTGNDELDKELAANLLQDEKENAEHVMLVDLARNDLNRGCDNVKVEFYKNVQFYSHVIHLVSRVSGNVKADTDSFGLFAGTFPAGTLSGAPKVRAMQLIRNIEKHTRGAYGGCIGYIGLNGDLNQAITIRSFLSKDSTLYYQAGAGIVSKSNPESELQEVNNKLGALKNAILKAAETDI